MQSRKRGCFLLKKMSRSQNVQIYDQLRFFFTSFDDLQIRVRWNQKTHNNYFTVDSVFAFVHLIFIYFQQEWMQSINRSTSFYTRHAIQRFSIWYKLQEKRKKCVEAQTSAAPPNSCDTMGQNYYITHAAVSFGFLRLITHNKVDQEQVFMYWLFWKAINSVGSKFVYTNSDLAVRPLHAPSHANFLVLYALSRHGGHQRALPTPGMNE